MSDVKFCTKCGASLDVSAAFCNQCGTPTNPSAPFSAANVAPTYTSDKNRITAGIFAILLGGIGVHKFYLNQIGLGIVYVLFCWTGIPSIIGIIEGIIYLTTTDDAFAAKYVH